MDMHMQMLELMFAPTRWLNLMVMPSYVDMDMSLRRLDGGVDDVHSGHNDHSSGALGDTTLAAILRVADTEHQGVHVGLGISAPSGDVGVRFRRSHQEERGFLHYGMQIGSGTWDFLPSLTYTGQMGRYAWGAQVAGVVRLEDENRSGYALGDIVRSTAWGGYALTPWLSASVRLAFELEDEISGEFDGRHSTTTAPDRPENYGGRFLDAGLGLTGSITGGVLRGQSVAIEWLQPLVTDFNGYQLERTGSLLVRWRIPF
jgi:hypothetical protein